MALKGAIGRKQRRARGRREEGRGEGGSLEVTSTDADRPRPWTVITLLTYSPFFWGQSFAGVAFFFREDEQHR